LFLFLVAKKKNPKKRFKDIDAKQDSNNTNLLSAFTDTPAKEEPPVVKVTQELPKEDPTWEDKVC